MPPPARSSVKFNIPTQLAWLNPSKRQPYDIPCCSRSHPVRHALPLLCAARILRILCILCQHTHRQTHSHTHTSVHTLKCPFVLQLQRTFLFWPQLIYASFLPPRLFSDFCHLTFAWLPAVAVVVVAVVFRFLFERFENFNFEFLSSERTNVPPSPLEEPS